MKYVLVKISKCTSSHCAYKDVDIGKAQDSKFSDINKAYKVCANDNLDCHACLCKYEVKEVEAK